MTRSPIELSAGQLKRQVCGIGETSESFETSDKSKTNEISVDSAITEAGLHIETNVMNLCETCETLLQN